MDYDNEPYHPPRQVIEWMKIADEYKAERDAALELLARFTSQCEGAETWCPLCGELLDVPGNDNGDGEFLGHALDCVIPESRALLAKETNDGST